MGVRWSWRKAGPGGRAGGGSGRAHGAAASTWVIFCGTARKSCTADSARWSEFLIFGGDILKFAGDAVLVLWRTPAQEVARTISLVLHCSRQIQKKYGRRDTDVGQKVQLKIGISAGPMSLLIFGDEIWQRFCIFGPCLAEVRDAEQVAGAGEVVLSAACWELCEKHRLRTKRLVGARAVQVTGMDPMPWSKCQDAFTQACTRPSEPPLKKGRCHETCSSLAQ
ncbi:adenylate cyclase type 10-like [Larus michahellis]|uniref:adenylate cyclase type 10-like n=1 Tax=Larus michahellis TaxID=119627 RepID=UPI003D9B33A8